MRSRPRPASATACCMARRWRSAWCWPSISPCASASPPGRMRIACGATLPRRACRPSLPRLGLSGGAADRLLAHMGKDKKVKRRRDHADPAAPDRRGVRHARRTGRRIARVPRRKPLNLAPRGDQNEARFRAEFAQVESASPPAMAVPGLDPGIDPANGSIGSRRRDAPTFAATQPIGRPKRMHTRGAEAGCVSTARCRACAGTGSRRAHWRGP